MATEADVPESISVTTEAGDGYVSTGKFDITVDQCSPLQLKKSEGQEDEHPEPVKCFVEGETARVESKNGISECGNPLEPLSDPKVGKQETCVAESFQVDESNQAETGIPDRENGEKGSEEKEAVEATEKKSEQHVESIVNAEAAEPSRSKTNIDEHVQVISDQQDSGDEIPTGKSFAMVYEERGPEVTSETKESAEDKLESASVLDDHEEKAGLGNEIQEKNIPDTALLTQTEDIIEESPKEVKNQYETLEETPEASGTASEAVKEDENAECQVEIPCMKREEDTLKKGDTLDTGEASVVEEEVLNVSTVKCDEGDQGDGTNPTKDDKNVDTFTAKVAEDDDYTSPVAIAETSAKVTPNDEESSPQTLQKRDSGEELQHLQDVMPEETKTETSRENAEETTCTKEETTTQNTQESLDEEKKEVPENTNNLEDDNARDEVPETAGAEQETGEHVVREIHTVAEPPQDFVDKETNEETSTEYQACTEAADLSINTEEKNLQEQAIPELSSPLVVEETAKETPKDEETDVLILKEEKKEEDAECNEPAEVKSVTREALPEATEDITEPNKDLNAAISEESNKTFVENISSLADVSETETEKNIREKDGLAVSNFDSVSGEVSHVTGLKEVETENEEQKENIDTAPEEKGQATILRDEMASEVEDIGVQAEENCESKEKLEEHIPTAADEGETLSKEAEAEKEEQIKYSDIASEEKEANILTDETPLEDTDMQAEKNVEPIENLEEQIPIQADEGETILKEAEAESKDEIKNTDGSHEDVDGQGEEVVNSEENLDKQIPTGDCETSLKEAEAEKEKQGKSTDIVPEEKGPEIILTDATSLDVEDIEVKAKHYVESKENVEEQIPIAADEEKTTYISLEDIDVQAEEYFITRENLENPILTNSDEQETGSEETKAEIKAQVKSIDIVPEEKGLETISTAETPLVLEDIDVKAEESFKSKENVEEQTPTAADEGEKSLKEAKAETKEQIDVENLNPQESSDKEKEEVTEVTNTIEDDTERGEVLETASTEQETGEHVVHEIHTVAESPQDSMDKETNEENSAEHQACTEAADMSTTAEEKNLEEHAIQELSSPLVVEETTKEILREEATYTTLTTLLEEEEKEGHATCNEATEEYAAEIEKNIQEKDGATLSNSESVSGELSHVTILKESETKIEMQDKDIDTVPEERGQATILANETALEVEDIDEQLKENFESKENLEEQFLIAADEGEIFLKETEEENKEQIKNADIAHEDVDVQAEKTVNSEEDIDKQIPPIADEGETSLKEAEAEIKEQVAYADIVPEEKGLAAILTDETPLEAEDTGVQAEQSFESKEKFEEKNPIPTDEDEAFLKEAEAENKEQIKYSDIAPEERGLATILTDENTSNIEDIGLQAEKTFNPSKNLESKIPSTDEYETSLKEAEAVNTEQVKYTDIVPEEKGLANIVTGETSLDVEDIDVKADENFESKENMEEQFPTAPHESGTFLDEDETFVKKAEAETKEQIKCSESAPEEKGLANSRDETSLDVKDIDVKADESFESNENVEEQIPTAAGEGETRLREAEAENDVQVKNDIASEEKVLPTISKDEMALNIDDAYVQAEANSDTKEFSDEQIPTAADEGEGKIAHGNVVLNETPGVRILKEAEPKVGVEEESCKSEDQPEKTNTIVEEVFDEPKITGRDFNKETSANVNGEEGLPQTVQEYEPVEGHEKLLDETPEESKTESSSKKAEVVSCTEEEETTPMNDTKENETEVEEVFEIASTEQETGEHATREIHTVEDNAQEFHDKETTVENLNEYKVSSEAADSSTDIVGKNSDEQASRELSSSLVGDNTSNESSKQEENYVSSLKEEEKEVNVECKEPVEGANMTHETKFETLQDSTEPKEDLYAHISEEETHTEESSKVVNSLQSEVSEKDGCTDLAGAEAETKEQVKDIEIDHEEKGLTTILTDGAALENVTSEEFPENQIPTVADEGECNTELVGDKAAEESLQVRSIEEAEPKLRVEDESRESEDHPENKNMIVEEPQPLEQVLDEPKSTDGDFSEGQTTEGNAAICAPEIIQEETAKNSQDSDKETENLQKEGSGIESVKYNTNDLSREFTPEDGSKKFDDNKQDTVKFEGEILKEPEIDGVGESTTYETNQIVETSEEILDASPVKYEEGQPGEGSSQDAAKASKEEDVSEVDDSNGAVTVTESSAVVTSKGEEDSAEASEKYEPKEEKVPVKISDVADAKEVCNLEDKASFSEKTTEETSLQKEGHVEVSELVPEGHVDATEEEFKEGSEIVPESDSRSIDVVSKDEIVTSQTLDKGILQEQVEIPSCTLLTEEKEIEASQYEHETPMSVEETILKKEEPGELKVSELDPEKLNAGETEEEIKKTPETVSEPDSPSTDVVSRDEAISDQTLHEGISTEKLQIPSSILLPEEKEIKASEEHRTTFCDKNIEENASNLQMQVDDNVKATSMEEETSLIKEEPRQLKASDFELQLKAEVPRKSSKEEIKEDEKLPEESEPYSVREESRDENKAKAEKQGEQIDETSTIKTNEHQNELSEVDEKGIGSDKYERQLTFEGLSINENDPRFIEDKTTHDGFPQEEKRVEEAAFEFVLQNQGDEINSKSSITSTQMKKDSSTEVTFKAPIVETSQGIESNESGEVISTESGTVSLPNLVPESTKETATACKELKTEEDEEEENEGSEQVKTDEEKGENEHKNREAGYESPIMVEASRDADVNVKVVSHKKSNNILSGIKHSMSKVKKAIIGKSSHPKTHSEK